MSRKGDSLASVAVMVLIALGWLFVVSGETFLGLVSFISGAGILASVLIFGSGRSGKGGR